MSPYVRKVPTASGAKAVQIIWSKKRGRAEVEHIGSAHDEAELELLTAVARQRIHAGQDELELGLAATDQSLGGSGRYPDGSAAGRDQRGVSAAGLSPGAGC